jgi:hypothetical protein
MSKAQMMLYKTLKGLFPIHPIQMNFRSEASEAFQNVNRRKFVEFDVSLSLSVSR